MCGEQAGADVVIDTSGDDAVELIRGATGGGPHAVIDFVGMAPTCAMGRDAMRKGGTQVRPAAPLRPYGPLYLATHLVVIRSSQ